MTDWDDLDGVAQPHISGEDAERLLSGASGVDSSGDLSDVSAVFQALRRPAELNELAGLESALAAFGTAAVTTHSVPSHARTRPMIKKILTGKTLAAIGAVTFISAGAAAAAGVVPSPFSSKPTGAGSAAVTDAQDDTIVTDTVLDTTPATDQAADSTVASSDSAPDDSDASDATEGQGPDVNGPAKFGLCTAFHARTKHDTPDTTPVDTTPVESSSTVADDQPPPFKALTEAAAAAGQTVDEFCADATPGGKSDDGTDQSSDNPSATAPGHSSDNPSVTAPGKADDNPSVTAPRHSGGNGNGHKPGTTEP